MSKDWVSDIAEMHRKFGLDKAFMDGNFLRFRQRFQEEELKELDEAINEKNPEKLVDALIDICVVAIGTLDNAKVNSYQAWDEVFRANMQKEVSSNPTRVGSKGFDLIKPEGWVGPSHEGNTGYFDAAILGIHARQIGFKNDLIPSHIQIIDEWRKFAISKDDAYNGDDPEFFHASYYPDGIDNIIYEIFKKVKRFRNALRVIKKSNGTGVADKVHETLKDSPRDIAIYAAIGEAYLNGQLEGQNPHRDIFNKPK